MVAIFFQDGAARECFTRSPAWSHGTAELAAPHEVQVTNVSGDDEEGEKLVKQYGVTRFPTYILSNAFSSSPRFPRLRRMVDHVGGDFVVNSRIFQKSVWFLRPRHVDRIDVFLPFGEFPSDLEFVDAFAQADVDLKIQYVAPPSLPAEDREELERRAALEITATRALSGG